MRRGYTLIELLIVIVIIMLLAGLLAAGAMAMVKQATRTRCHSLLAKVATAIEAYRQDRMALPVFASGYAAGSWAWVATTSNTLYTELLTTTNDHRGNPRKGYLIGEIDQANAISGTTIVDPWGQPLIFYGPPWSGPLAYPGNATSRDFELWSAGPDGKFDDLRPGASGDVDNDNLPARPYDPSTLK